MHGLVVVSIPYWRRTGVAEVGDGPRTEVARVWSDRWIFAVMETYSMTNDTDLAAEFFITGRAQ